MTEYQPISLTIHRIDEVLYGLMGLEDFLLSVPARKRSKQKKVSAVTETAPSLDPKRWGKWGVEFRVRYDSDKGAITNCCGGNEASLPSRRILTRNRIRYMVNLDKKYLDNKIQLRPVVI